MKRFVMIAALVGLALWGSSAEAQQPIASFQPRSLNNRQFVYTNNSNSSATLAIGQAGNPSNYGRVSFTFLTPNVSGVPAGTPIQAFAKMSATTMSSVTSDGHQVIDQSLTFEFRKATGSDTVDLSAGGLLMTVSFTNAIFNPNTTQTGSIQAADSSATQSVVLSSQYFTQPVTSETMSLSLDAIMPQLSLSQSSGFYPSFDAVVTGSFSGNFVPEPSSLALVGLGLVGLPAALAARRRRRRDA